MIKVCLSIISLCFYITVQTQDMVTILECTYNQTILNSPNERTTIVRISKDKIGYWGERAGKITLITVFDFGTNKMTSIGLSGNVMTFNLGENRKAIALANTYEQVNTFIANAKISDYSVSEPNEYMPEIRKIYDTVFFDTTIKIPYYLSGGYSGFLDNGFGYLPIKSIRNVTLKMTKLAFHILML